MVAARLPVEDLEKHPQLALEENLRQGQESINSKIALLKNALVESQVDPAQTSAALELITDEAKKLRDEAEEHKINVAQTNAFVTHDDLDGSLVEQVAELQNDIQEKKRLQAETEKVLELAPKVELISQSLQSMPSQLPTTLDEQQTLLEDMEIKKQNLQNLISSMNDAPAAEELKQKSEWDLSRIKDLLQQLGSAVGDKLAALAAFNAARREAEEKLLTITADATDKPLTAEQAQADENAIAALEEHIKTLSVEELDENERREYADLLARLQNASQVLEKRRIEAEQLQQKQADEEAFQQTILLRDSDAVPGQYEPTARELNSEVELARKVINDAGVAAGPQVEAIESLETTIQAAQQLANGLEERAQAWREFVVVRDETDATLGKLRTPLERVLEKPKRSASEASDDMKEIRDASHDIQILNANVANLQRLSEALNPLESAYAEVRFADVDTEQTQKQYDELLNELATELEDDRIRAVLDQKTPDDKTVLEGISQHQIPALKAQINLLQDRNVEAVATRKHVAPEIERINELSEDIRQLEEAVEESKIAAEMAEKEQLVLVLTSLQEAKQLHEDTKKALHGDVLALEKDVDSFLVSEPAVAKSKKGKKGKKEPTALTVEDVEQKNSPTPICSSEDKLKVEDFRQRVNSSADDKRNVLASMLDDLQKHAKASETMKRLSEALERTETALETIPQTTVAITDFKEAMLPHLTSLLEEVSVVPQDLEPTANELRTRVATLEGAVNSKLDDAVAEQQRLDQLNRSLDELSSILDSVVPKYENPQKLEVAREDLGTLNSILEMVAARLPVEDLEKHPQLARDIKNLQNKTKDLATSLEKSIPVEENLRQGQESINSKIALLKNALVESQVDPAQTSAALELITDEAKKLRDEAEEHKINVAQTNAFVTHDDLDGSLVEQVAELQNDIQEKKRLQAETEKVLELAPKVELISQSLQSMPSQLPTTLDEQQTLLEDMEIKKQNLQNLISSMNDAPAAEELKQKSEWDLSRIKDLLQQLGSANKPKLTKNAIAALEEHIKTLSVEELDENERREYADLLARLQNASQVLEKRRIEAEQLQQKQADEEAFQQTIVPIFNRLTRLVTEADELLRDSDAVPGQYEPTARELNSEVELARKVINDAGVAAGPQVEAIESLETTIQAAQQLANGLEERAQAWREFVVVRDETDATLGKLRTPLERVLEKPKRSASEASDDMKEIRDASHDIQILNANVANLQRLSEALNPLESAYAEVRFADVDTEQTQKQYDELLNELATELEDDRVLGESAELIAKEIEEIRAVLDQKNSRRQDRPRGNLTTSNSCTESSNQPFCKIATSKLNLKIAAEMAEKEQLVLVLTVRLSQLEGTPLEEVDPQELIDLSHKLDLLTPDQASAVKPRSRAFKEAKQLHEDTKKSSARRQPAVAKSKKGKKGKKEPTALTVEDVEQKNSPTPICSFQESKNWRATHSSARKTNSKSKISVNGSTVPPMTSETGFLKRWKELKLRWRPSTDDCRNHRFQRKRCCRILTNLLEEVSVVPQDLEPTANELRTRVATLEGAVNSKLDDAVAEQQRLDQLNRSLDELSSILDSVVPKYENPQKAGSG
ncbi:unnamed protein product [Caenorhabditis auriculariae]|uniref:Uncharacterized protein n=1 Tax=Caenorhabditis auriculariae TaxID=2777116 RepID=A0A8S1GMX3_9PELO|nr:unnamed protein product [Caenorhabditis auriculariae]